MRNEGRTNKHYVSGEGRVRGEAGLKELKIKNSRLKIRQYAVGNGRLNLELGVGIWN